jgi:hypothetical protein
LEEEAVVVAFLIIPVVRLVLQEAEAVVVMHVSIFLLLL